jgi:hypothetical protein
VILALLEKRQLLDAALKLRTAQRDQVAPEIAPSVDLDIEGPGHVFYPGQGRGRLRGGPLLRGRLWLRAAQVVGGALGVTGGCEDETLLVLQHDEP